MARVLTPAQFNQAVRRLVTEGLAEIELEVMRGALRFAVRSAVDKSPFLTGRYRASHRPSVGNPQYAALPPAPAYSIPGDLEVDAAMTGYTPGTLAYVTNDAKSKAGYVYAQNVEHLGWGAKAAYRVYERTLAELQSKMGGITQAAVAKVARRFQ